MDEHADLFSVQLATMRQGAPMATRRKTARKRAAAVDEVTRRETRVILKRTDAM